MNDPEFATNNSGEDGSNEADTCRICRGEATDLEPLFYPCKCNGSIKFVHQDCLMEWLSHSQKKHCELCKTPFRFTKLYSPHMPQQLPLHIFAHRLLIHAAKFAMTSMRFLLVAFVWLGWLPWAMRAVWRMLFWIADGGWTSRTSLSDRSASSMRALELAQEQLENLSATIIASGVSPLPENTLQPHTTTSAAVGDIMAILPALLEPFTESLNATVGENMVWTMFKNFFYGLGLHMTSSLPESPFNNVTSSQSTGRPSFSGASTLLSEVGFLKNLTRWKGLNQVFISVLEGQIITVFVVVCFILIFLIREWVVQQQPGINMGAGFNAEFAMPGRAEARDREIHERALDRAHQLHNDQVVDPAEENPNFPDFDLPNREQERDPIADRRIADRRIAQPRRRIVRFDDEMRDEADRIEPPPYHDDDGPNAGGARRGRLQRMHIDLTGVQGALLERQRDQTGDAPLSGKPAVSQSNSSQPGHPPQRPGMPTRDALSPAAEIQRRLAEERQPRQDNPGQRRDTKEFLAIYRRAEGKPEEVLRIMEAEGLEQRMDYWVRTMKALQKTAHLNARNRRLGGGQSDDSLSAQASNESNGSWVDLSAPMLGQESANVEPLSQSLHSNGKEETIDIKGKGKAVDPPVADHSGVLPEALTNSGQNRSPLANQSAQPASDDVSHYPTEKSSTSANRPRASSDGPQFRENSLLSYNTWDFPSQFRAYADTSAKDVQGGHEHSSPSETWKEAQDMKVQEVVTRAIEHRAYRRSGAGGQVADGSQQMAPGRPSDEFADIAKSALDEHSVPHDTLGPISAGPLDGTDSNDGFANEDDLTDLSSDDDFDENPADEGPEPNPFHPEGVLPPEREPIVRRPDDALGVLGRIADWLWGDMGAGEPRDEHVGNDEHVVQDLAAEAPFVPVANAQNRDLRAEAEQADPNLEVLEAAIAAGIDPNDPDALDEAEDFDGIMELIGMRGPLTGLLQNGMFSAVLISLTVSCGIWIPYNFGRLVLLLLAHPVSTAKMPLKLVFSFAELLIDMSLVAIGLSAYTVLCLAALPTALFSIASASVGSPTFLTVSKFGSQAWQISLEASSRIASGFLQNVWHIADSEVPAFSATSHESLLILKSWLYKSVAWVAGILATVFAPKSLAAEAFRQFWKWDDVAGSLRDGFSSIPGLLVSPSSWIISLNTQPRSLPLEPELAFWSGVDRFWAIFAGYTALSVLGALYLHRGVPFSTGRTGKEYEAHIADIFNQAGGVMKVILIISIEMLVFPLYCGLLLDFALLPVFENATFMSRILFTITSPLTSIFVHWFVGTCYMFHFALFVSMCRKIMRKGVLYFIRDPDDPTFHPVRDVLERNVYTQLRKITFSALVYGALVIVCLGGVVWGLSFAFKGILPIHWSSNEPVLEFPIDLLFYNFMMPLAVRFFKPSDGLHAIYSWWFRRCAHMLRLTWFLFDERKKDEEGHHVRRHWSSILTGANGDPEKPYPASMTSDPFKDDSNLQAYFIRDGKYVRTPASDQVRIPKGANVFFEVTEDNVPIDLSADHDSGLHGQKSDQFKKVYIPPLFRFRIFVFILSIWLFAALTGVCITVIPLVFGREIFKLIIPSHLRMNDIYAFSIGIYILGGILYCSFHAGRFLSWAKNTIRHFIATMNCTQLLHRSMTFISLGLKVAYLYSSITLLLPTLCAMIIEFYLIVPLHTYFSGGRERHITHFIQSWTLGLLYVKLMARIISWHSETRAARALRQITAEPHNWLNPNVRIATRFFILPTIVVSFLVLSVPLILGWITSKCVLGMNSSGNEMTEVQRTLIYRYSYPGTLVLGALGWSILGAVKVMRGWRTRIRDEVYLIGERLHNFGDGRRKGGVANGVRGVVVGRRVDT